jgi:hypothetical protein
MAKPAASSAAELIFLPDESLSIAVESSREDSASDRWAFNDPMFVFTTMLITDPCWLSQALPLLFFKEGAACCRFNVESAKFCRLQGINRGSEVKL